MEIFLGDFLTNVFTAESVPKKRSLEHPECCIRCTSACGRFRVCLKGGIFFLPNLVPWIK